MLFFSKRLFFCRKLLNCGICQCVGLDGGKGKAVTLNQHLNHRRSLAKLIYEQECLFQITLIEAGFITKYMYKTLCRLVSDRF